MGKYLILYMKGGILICFSVLCESVALRMAFVRAKMEAISNDI